MSAHDFARQSGERLSIPAPTLSFKDSATTHRSRAEGLASTQLVQPLGSSERMFVDLHRHAATNVIRVIALEGVLPPAEVKLALQLLAARHPLMRARIVSEGTPHLRHGDAPTLRVRVIERRDDTHWQEELERLLNTKLEYEAGPLFEVHYLRGVGAGRSELIVVGEHAVCDGVSMNNLCAELLELCARKALRAARPSLPVLDQLLPQFAPHVRARRFSRAFWRLARVTVARALLERRKAARTSAYAFFTLSPAETKALIVNARRAATTLTGVVMAAALQAVRELRPKTPNLALSVPVNLRPRMPTQGITHEDLANLTSAVCLESDGRGDLWALARSLRGQLDYEVENTLLQSVDLTYKAGRRFIRRGRAPLAHAMLSNSGVVAIQRDYGPFRIHGFFSATSAPMVSADLCFFCNTFHDQLTVNVVFPPEVVARTEAQRVLERVRSLVTSC